MNPISNTPLHQTPHLHQTAKSASGNTVEHAMRREVSGVPEHHPHLNAAFSEVWAVLDNDTAERLSGTFSDDKKSFTHVKEDKSVIKLKHLPVSASGPRIYGESSTWRHAGAPGNQHHLLKGVVRGDTFIADAKQPDLAKLIKQIARDEVLLGGTSPEYAQLCKVSREDNDVAAAKAILEEHPDCINENGDLFNEAAWGNQVKFLEVFLEYVDPRILNEAPQKITPGEQAPPDVLTTTSTWYMHHGLTPLQRALNHGRLEAAQLLLKHEDIDVNRSAPGKPHPIEMAIKKDFPAFALDLLNHPSCDPAIVNSHPSIATAAVLKNHADVIKALLADERITIAANPSLVVDAITIEHFDIVETLLSTDRIDINQADENGAVALHSLAEYPGGLTKSHYFSNRMKIADLFFDSRKVDIARQDNLKRNILFLAEHHETEFNKQLIHRLEGKKLTGALAPGYIEAARHCHGHPNNPYRDQKLSQDKRLCRLFGTAFPKTNKLSARLTAITGKDPDPTPVHEAVTRDDLQWFADNVDDPRMKRQAKANLKAFGTAQQPRSTASTSAGTQVRFQDVPVSVQRSIPIPTSRSATRATSSPVAGTSSSALVGPVGRTSPPSSLQPSASTALSAKSSPPGSLSSTSMILASRRSSLSTLQGALDAKGKKLYRVQQQIIAQLDEIYKTPQGETYFEMSKLAFLTAFKGSEALRTGIFPYDPKVDTSLGQSLGLAAFKGAGAAATLASGLGETAEKTLKIAAPGVGEVLSFVFDKIAAAGYNAAHEQIAKILDTSGRNIHYFSDSAARDLALVHRGNLQVSNETIREGLFHRSFGESFNLVMERFHGRSTNEVPEETAIRLLATQHAVEIVFALAMGEPTLTALVAAAVRNPEKPYETDHLKLEPVLEWHIQKHFPESRPDIDSQVMHVWGERDSSLTARDVDEEIQKRQQKDGDRHSRLEKKIAEATGAVKERMDDLETRAGKKFSAINRFIADSKKEFVGSMDARDARISTIEGELTTVKNGLNAVVKMADERSEVINESMEEMQKTINEHDEQFKDINAKVNTFGATLTALESDPHPSAVTTERETELLGQISEQDRKIASLTKENTTLNELIDTLTTKIDRLEKRVEGNVGRIHQFAFEVDDRINKLAQQVTPASQAAPAPETQSLSSGSSVSSAPTRRSQVVSGKIHVENTNFKLRQLAQMLESYLSSGNVQMPGALLPSPSLKWSGDGDLIIDLLETRTTKAFRGTVAEFMKMVHKTLPKKAGMPPFGWGDKGLDETVKFKSHMESALERLGMSEHYDAMIEEALPFTAAEPGPSSSAILQL